MCSVESGNEAIYIPYSGWFWGNKECYGVIESGDGLSDNMKSTYVNNGK